jgi:hypothetical protein
MAKNEYTKLQKISLHDENDAAFTNDNPLPVSDLSYLVSEKYTKVELTYVTVGNGIGEIETALYYNGVSLIATLTLGYDAQDRLISIERT